METETRKPLNEGTVITQWIGNVYVCGEKKSSQKDDNYNTMYKVLPWEYKSWCRKIPRKT